MSLQNSGTDLPVVKCSRCDQQLKYLGSYLDDVRAHGGTVTGGSTQSEWVFQFWNGTVCTHCRMVYCRDCQESGRATPCRNCGQPVRPASHNVIPARPALLAMDKPPFSSESLPRQSAPEPAPAPRKPWWRFWR